MFRNRRRNRLPRRSKRLVLRSSQSEAGSAKEGQPNSQVTATTFVKMLEHDMKTVMGLCDKLSVLDFGKLLVEGPPDEILNNPQVIEAYLGAEVV